MIDPIKVRIAGALSVHRKGLWKALLALQYSPLSARNLLRVAAHLSRWLDEQRLGLEELTHERIESFFDDRRRAGYVQFLTAQSLHPMLSYLETVGAIALPAIAARAPTELDRLTDEYRIYLVRERGLSVTSVRAYGDDAQRFLRMNLGQAPNLAQLQASDVSRYVVEMSSRYSTGRTKYIVTVLRSLLRYLYLRGHLTVDLSGAIPAVAGWRLRGLPKALDSGQVRELLRSADRRRATGRRAYAVLLLMLRLGLRQGEVAALTLDDIDWQQGEILIRGKGPREDRLPLPADVGDALAGYLRHGRPQTTAREVFLSVRAPHSPLGSSGIGALVCRVMKRAGLPAPNAHRLRHTAATEMLRVGASLDEIAQVLRHRSHDTTAIYTKVDRHQLRRVTRPWPGATS